MPTEDDERRAAAIAKMEALGRPPPGALLRGRILLALAVIGSGALGYFLFGWWAIPLGWFALIVVVVLAVVVRHSVGNLLRGPSEKVGELRLHIDAAARLAKISSTFRDEDRSLAALAFAERTLFYWSLNWRLAAPAEPLLAALRDIADGRIPALAEGWTVGPGDAAALMWAGVTRNRLGMGLSMGGSIGGPKPGATELNAACAAFVRDAAIADPGLSPALLALCDAWSKPNYVDDRRFRKAVRLLRSGA